MRVSIQQTIRKVQTKYPFPDIFEDTEATINVVAKVLRDMAPPGGRLLDIGCGALDKPTVFQELGYSCFACDTFQDPWHLHSDNLEVVLDFAREVGVEVYSQGEDYTVPWEEGSFDVVTVINVIEHLHESPRDILNFAGSYLKEGGLLVVNMPNSVNLRKRLSVLLGRTNYTSVKGFYEHIGQWRGHVREYTLAETRQIVEWSGFDIVNSQTYHGMLSRRLPNPWLQLIFKGICSPFPGYRDGLLVAGRKPAGWTPRHADQDAMREAFGVPEYAKQ